jgi:hypothetical protein
VTVSYCDSHKVMAAIILFCVCCGLAGIDIMFVLATLCVFLHGLSTITWTFGVVLQSHSLGLPDTRLGSFLK